MLTASLWIFAFTYFQFSEHFIHENYWRYSFIIAGIIIGVMGYYLRKTMPETPAFIALKTNREIFKLPFLHILKTRPIALIICILLAAYTSFATYTLFVYMADYLKTDLHEKLTVALLMTALIGLIESLAAPFFAYLSDIFGRLKVMGYGTACMVILVIPLFKYMQNNSLLIIFLNLSILACCLATFDGPMIAYLLEQFEVGERYSGLGVGYNLGVGIIGGSAPLILSFLITKTHNQLMPGFFLAGLAALVLIALSFYTHYKRSIC